MEGSADGTERIAGPTYLDDLLPLSFVTAPVLFDLLLHIQEHHLSLVDTPLCDLNLLFHLVLEMG